MIRLASSEWLRFWSRRLVWVLILLLVVAIAVVGVIAAATSHRPTPTQIARAQQEYERQLAQCIKHVNFGVPIPPGMTVEEACHAIFPEGADSFVDGNELRLGELPTILQGTSFIVILVGLVIGASSVGASWQTGTITTILAWEPRRVRWFVTRVLVTAVGVFLIAMVLVTLLSLALAAAASLRGSTTLPSGWFGEVVRTILRVAGVAVGASMIGAAVAMIGRNTVAALGAVFVYMAVLEGVVRGLRPGLSRFMLGDNLAAVVGNTTLEVHQGFSVYRLTPGRGWMVFAVYVASLVIAATALLRSRDVN